MTIDIETIRADLTEIAKNLDAIVAERDALREQNERMRYALQILGSDCSWQKQTEHIPNDSGGYSVDRLFWNCPVNPQTIAREALGE